MTAARRLVVVGGGITGLAAAYHAARRGIGTVLLEAGKQVGFAAPKEGFRGWCGCTMVYKHVSGPTLDAAYKYLNWWLSGFPGANMARQAYYSPRPDTTAYDASCSAAIAGSTPARSSRRRATSSGTRASWASSASGSGASAVPRVAIATSCVR